jgi:hypothetical protein
MSFYSSLLHYRPGAPAPRVTGTSLARFVAQLPATQAFQDDGLFILNVKFGRSIDQDNLPTITLEGEGCVKTVRDIEWDLSPEVKCINDVVSELEGHDRSIYRAHVMLGSAAPSIVDRLSRESSPENEINLYLDTWSIDLGPAIISDLVSPGFQVGWMDVSLHGGGYLFPWTFRDLITKAESCLEVLAVAQLCRSTWPVPSRRPTWRERRMRKRLGLLWPYEDVWKTWDWCWGLSETG